MSQHSLLDETMSEADVPSLPGQILLNIKSLNLTEEQFELLCRDNRDLRIELTAQGELVIMSPTGMKTGWRNSKLTFYFTQWTLEDGTGICCDSSTLFTLPNGAKRSPDVSWIRQDRVDALTEEQQAGFTPICPDFVLELRTPSSNEKWTSIWKTALNLVGCSTRIASASMSISRIDQLNAWRIQSQ